MIFLSDEGGSFGFSEQDNGTMKSNNKINWMGFLMISALGFANIEFLQDWENLLGMGKGLLAARYDLSRCESNTKTLTGFVEPRYCSTDVRLTTRRSLILHKKLSIASMIPLMKYSFSSSGLSFLNGKTAIDLSMPVNSLGDVTQGMIFSIINPIIMTKLT